MQLTHAGEQQIRGSPEGAEFATHLSVGIAQLDSDVPFQLVLEPDSVDSRDGLHHRGLAVCHMTDGACHKEKTGQRGGPSK